MHCKTIEWTHRIDIEQWWTGPANGIGTLGALMLDQPPLVAAHIRHEYERLNAPYREPNGMLALPTAALLAAGEAT